MIMYFSPPCPMQLQVSYTGNYRIILEFTEITPKFADSIYLLFNRLACTRECKEQEKKTTMTVVLIKEAFQIHNLLNEHEFGTGDP